MTKSDMKNKPEIGTKKIRPIKGVIVDAIKETPDTWTLKIFVDSKDKDYKAGQFISIDPYQVPELRDILSYFEYIKGKKEQVRAYSLSSAPFEKHVAITIKPECYFPAPGAYPPILSPLLASDMLINREIEFTGYAGAYVMPTDLSRHCDHAIHLAAGSGIVPSFSIIKDELVNNKNTHMKHTLIYINKTHEDIIFHNEINELARTNPGRFMVRYFLTRDPEFAKYGVQYVQKRPTINHIDEIIEDKDRTLVFACGPAITKWQKKRAKDLGHIPTPRFMEWVQEVVNTLGINKKHYKKEVYG